VSREDQLARSTIVYFIGSFGSKLLSFLLLPVYSKYLTAEAYGSYDLISTLLQIISPFITLMLDNALYVYVIGTDNTKERDNIISFCTKVMLTNSCVAVVGFLVFNYFCSVKYIGWIIVWLVSSNVNATWLQIARSLKKQKLYSLTGVIITAITLSGNIIGLVILGQDYRFLMISNCLAYTVSIVFLESRLHVVGFVKRGNASRSLKLKLLKYSAPLLPNQLSWWILNVSDRVMISYFLGTGANGIYAMACKIPGILMVVHGIFAAAWSDDILTSGNMKDTEVYAERIYNMYIRVLIGITVVLMSANKFLFKYIISGNFIESFKYTYFLYIGFIFSSLGSLLGAFYGYFKKSLNVSLSTIVSALVNFMINYLFLARYGIEIASLSTCAGSFTIWIIRLAGLRNIVRVRIYRATKYMFAIFIPLYFLKDIEGFVQNLVLIFAGVAVAVLINMKTIIEIGSRLLIKIKRT
jgi:O-antigen/teichoic acid export membrane protein